MVPKISLNVNKEKDPAVFSFSKQENNSTFLWEITAKDSTSYTIVKFEKKTLTDSLEEAYYFNNDTQSRTFKNLSLQEVPLPEDLLFAIASTRWKNL